METISGVGDSLREGRVPHRHLQAAGLSRGHPAELQRQAAHLQVRRSNVGSWFRFRPRSR